MAISYKKIQMQAALRSGELVGTDAATLEAAYAAAWTSASLDGGIIPVSGFADTILAVEKEIAHVIASDTQQPYRQHLYGRSAALANNAQILLVDNANKAFIGVFSGVIDAVDLKPLTEMPVQTIDDLSADFFSNSEFYHFAFTGQRIRHTRTTVFLEGCSWDYATQLAAYSAVNGASPLPQTLENTWIAGVLAQLPQTAGWFASEGQMYQGVYDRGLQMLKARDLSAPILPDKTAHANAVVN